jgi:hypothetical protein
VFDLNEAVAHDLLHIPLPLYGLRSVDASLGDSSNVHGLCEPDEEDIKSLAQCKHNAIEAPGNY